MQYLFEHKDGKSKPVIGAAAVRAANERIHRESGIHTDDINTHLRGDGVKLKDGISYSLREVPATLQAGVPAEEVDTNHARLKHQEAVKAAATKQPTATAAPASGAKKKSSVTNVPGGQKFTQGE